MRGLLQHSMCLVATERAMDVTPLSSQTKSSEELSPDLPERLKQFSELSAFTIKWGATEYCAPGVPQKSKILILTGVTNFQEGFRVTAQFQR